jgi:3-oxoacyl-(acyl-carrier-protein) synthase
VRAFHVPALLRPLDAPAPLTRSRTPDGPDEDAPDEMSTAPLGPDAPSTWAAMREGRSAIGPLRTIPTDGLRCAVAAEIPDFDPAARIDVRRLGYMDRFTQFAVFAATEALDAAGLRGALGARAGVVIGAGTGGAVAETSSRAAS